MTNEISRSLAGYTQRLEKVYPQRALITGFGSLVPGLVSHLRQHLKLPVEYFDIGRRLLTKDNDDQHLLNTHALHLSELLGEASNDLMNKRSRINLLPNKFKDEISFRRRKPYSLTAKCLLIVIGALVIFHNTKTLKSHQNRLAQINDHLQPRRELQKDIFTTKNSVIATRDKIQSLEGLVNLRANWIYFFVDLQQRLSRVEDVRLDDLEVIPRDADQKAPSPFKSDSPRLRLKGRMLDRENPLERVSDNLQRRVNRMLNQFTQSAYISKVQDKTFDTSTNGILAFEFTLILQSEKALW